MTTLEFIESIKTVPLTREEYASVDFVGQACEDHIHSYDIPAKEHPQDFEVEPEDALITLVSQYDATRLPIGLLFFDELVSTDDDFFQVATIAATSVCLCRYTGQVLIVPDYDIDDEDYLGDYDPDIPYNTRYRCAVNGGAFLEALVYAAAFLENNVTNPSIFNNTPVIKTVSEHCADLAGSPDYEPFWSAFLFSEFL